MKPYLTREDIQRALKLRKPLTKKEAEKLFEAVKKQLSFSIKDIEK